ncbi:MAG: transposase [Geminicoccaceae bacterium]
MRMLSDETWVRLEAALDGARSGTGRPLRDERRLVEGVIWRQRNGAKWRALPPEYGPLGSHSVAPALRDGSSASPMMV